MKQTITILNSFRIFFSRNSKLVLSCLLLCLFSLSCVSVNLGPKNPTKSEKVELNPPRKPFKETQSSTADAAWLNKENGNSISYLSICNDPADPTLEFVRNELLATLDHPKILNSFEAKYNGRESLSTVAEGEVDGVKTRLELLVFKKNNCTYSLSYVGVDAAFGADQAIFHEFLTGFRAP